MLKLFYAPTSPSLKVIIFLIESELPYRSLPINVFKKQNYNEEYSKIIPTKKTPALLDDGKVLFDSANILLYLSQKEDKFLPKNNINTTLSWFFWGTSELNAKFSQYSYFLYNNGSSDMLNKTREQLDNLLIILDKQLENKDYIVNNEYSIVDINLYPSIKLYIINNIPNLVDNFPNIQKWLSKIDKKESTKKALNISVAFNKETMITNEEVTKFLNS